MNRASSFINPEDSLARQNEKLLTIADVLVKRVEQVTDDEGASYAHFQRAVMLEDQVRTRTRELERALDLLNASNNQLAEANRAAEDARATLAGAIETIQEGFALFDADDQLLLFNSRFGMFMPDIRAALAPRLTFSDYIEQVSLSPSLDMPQGETPESWRATRHRRHQDKHVVFNVSITGDRWVQVSEHRTPDGQTVIMQTDITDIMRLERRERSRILDNQARLIGNTLEHLDHGVTVFDGNGHLVSWNRIVSDLLSIPVSNLRLGTDFSTLLNKAQDIDSDTMTIDQVVSWVNSQNRPPMAFEMTRGKSVVLHVTVQEMPDRGFVAAFSDITAERENARTLLEAKEGLERRVQERTLELEDALADAERANASKSRFVAAASHDLLQPLSAAKLFVASAAEDTQDPNRKTTLQKALGALNSVDHIIDALLDISKLESGAAAVEIEPVQVRPLLEQLSSEFTPLASQKGLDLRMYICDAVIETDASYIRRILQNLIGNAVRYTQSGRVVVGARRRGRQVRFEIWDTGPGIPNSDLEDIFKEFHRLNARASASEGMGLGLAIVERACGLLRHPLSVASTPERGSVFSVSVPLARGRSPGSVPKPHATPVSTGLAGTLVLLVENDDELRRALTLTMERWGVAVIEASSGKEAQDLLNELAICPDVLLIDYQLSDGETGLDVRDMLDPLCSAVPARIITADRSLATIEACRARGIQIMHKPIDPVGLASFLTEVALGSQR